MKKSWIGFFLVFMLFFEVTVAPMSASAASPQGTQEANSATASASQALAQSIQEQKFVSEANALETHLQIRGGFLYLNAKSGKQVGISEAEFQNFSAALEHTNSLIRNHTVALSSVLLRTTSTAASEATSKSCPGKTAMYYYWWGEKGYADECRTLKIRKELALGASLGFVCGFAGPAAPVCGAVFGVLGLYATIIWVADKGKGVIFWKPFGLPPYVTGQ
jgi:hypothetical protein